MTELPSALFTGVDPERKTIDYLIVVGKRGWPPQLIDYIKLGRQTCTHNTTIEAIAAWVVTTPKNVREMQIFLHMQKRAAFKRTVNIIMYAGLTLVLGISYFQLESWPRSVSAVMLTVFSGLIVFTVMDCFNKDARWARQLRRTLKKQRST